MSVVGRLWRRAPAWRFCLVTAVACTGLAAMFPPGLPQWPVRWRAGGSVARYGAQGDRGETPSPGLDQVHAPTQAPPQQGSVRFAGRMLPLPSGTWHEVAIVKSAGAEALQAEILDRVKIPTDPALTGLILVTAPSPLSPAVGSVTLPSPCQTIGRNPGQITPTLPSQSPLAHECWVLAPVDTARVRRAPEDDVLKLALLRLAELHVAVPPQMLALDYARSDETGWLNVTILLPGGGNRLKAVQSWAARFSRPLHRGYDRTLVPADLTPAVVDDPP